MRCREINEAMLILCRIDIAEAGKPYRKDTPHQLPLSNNHVSLFTFAFVATSRWFAEIWQLSRRGAKGKLEVEFKFQRPSESWGEGAFVGNDCVVRYYWVFTFYLLASFLKKVRQFRSSRISEVSYELRYVPERSYEQKLASKFFSKFSQKKWNENFVRQSLANITRVARINSWKKILDLEREKGPENPAKLKA